MGDLRGVAKNGMADGLTLSLWRRIVIGVKHLPVCSDVVQTGHRDHILGKANPRSAWRIRVPTPGKVVAGVGPAGTEISEVFAR